MLRSRKILSAASRNVNGGSLLQKEEKLIPIIPIQNPLQRTSARFLDIHELATKAAVEQSRARIKDEMSRGYFQDMMDLKKHGGKISRANKTIVPATSALKFPTLEVSFPDGSKLKLPITSNGNEANVPTSNTAAKDSSSKLSLTSKTNDTNDPTSDSAKASLISISFRSNAQTMVDSWIAPFQKTFGNSSNICLIEVSLIDSWLLRRWLIKKLLIKFMRKPTPEENQGILKRQIGYSFADHYYFRKELKIINLLTGYVFLVDKLGRVRWQGNGAATEDELLSLLSCTSILLEERSKKQNFD